MGCKYLRDFLEVIHETKPFSYLSFHILRPSLRDGMPDSFNITFQIQNHQLYLVSYHEKYHFYKQARNFFESLFLQKLYLSNIFCELNSSVTFTNFI